MTSAAMGVRHRPGLTAVALLATFVLAWQVVETFLAPTRTVIPTPLAIIQTLIAQAGPFRTHTLATAQEAILGFVVGCGAAIALAVLSLASRSLEGALLRIAIALHSAPIIVVAPLIVLWFGPGLQTRVTVSALACFFIVLVNTIRGLNSVSRESQELLHVLSASRVQSIWKVRVPYALPYIFTALKVAAAAAVLGAIIGEWVGADQGLGVVLFYSLFQFEVPRLWTAMLLCTLLAMGGYALVGLAEKLLIPWHESVKIARLEGPS